ncbi:transcription factor IBH1-like [Humulus lupulus]|uniref:transcription factor IBH1-like n=1 Tax=Humulus lupulus TaxID=3486 RepID=UPI002B403920|nr:transcription factor IBH1-like [Humulus lupulus]
MKTCPKLGSIVALNDNDSRRKSSTRTKFALRFIRSLMEMKRRGHVSSSSSNTDNNNVSSAVERSERIKVAAYSSMAHAVGPRRAWARALIFKLRRRAKRRRVLMKMNRSKSLTCLVLKKKKKKKLKKKRVVDYDDEDDVLSHTDRLRGLVPGGKAMDICSLFDETAHFIMSLATQVKVMQDIADHLSSK